MTTGRLNVKIAADLVPLDVGGWSNWSRSAELSFLAAGFKEYLKGTVDPRLATTQKREEGRNAQDYDGELEIQVAEWESMNERIIGILGGIVVDHLGAKLLEKTMTAAEAYALLKSRTCLSKREAMRALFKVSYSSNESIQTTELVITDLFDRIWEDGPPSREEWGIAIRMNMLEGTEYDWVLNSILMTPEKQLTELDVINMIDAASDDMQRSATVANVAKETKCPSKIAKCTNCGRKRHARGRCWAKGG